jgi:hypothetical protein
MASDSGDDAAALRERVAQLEQTVAEQQATIESLSSPTASRRGVLAALTGVAGAGAVGAYSQRGAAQAAGQVGTSSAPVDVFANAIDANAVETGEQTINNVPLQGYVLEDTEGTVNLSTEFSTAAGGTLFVQKELSGSESAIYATVGGGSPRVEIMTTSDSASFGTTQGESSINVYADGDIFAEITDGSTQVSLLLVVG